MQLILLLLFGIATVVQAQPPDSAWSWTYGAEASDIAQAAVRGSDGHWLVGGRLTDPENGAPSIAVAKLDDGGDTVWVRDYYMPFVLGSTIEGMIATADSGCIIATVREGTFPWPAVVRLGSSGDTVWTRRFPIWGNAAISAIAWANATEFVVAGVTWTFIDGGWGVDCDSTFFARMTAEGDLQWLQTYDLAPGTGGSYLLELPNAIAGFDGGMIFCGKAGGASIIAKLNGAGNLQWTRAYDCVGGYPSFNDIHPATDGGLIVFGTGMSDSTLGSQLRLLKTNPDGEMEWFCEFGGADIDYGVAGEIVSNGYLFAGCTRSFGSGNFDFWLVWANLDGNSLWSQTFGTDGLEYVTDMTLALDGGALLVGRTTPPPSANTDWWVVRVASELSAEDSHPIAAQFALSQNYPNPFNASTTISFDLPRDEHVLLNVFDITGRSVATVADAVLSAGSHQMYLNASTLPSGVYVYRLQTETVAQSRKMVVLR